MFNFHFLLNPGSCGYFCLRFVLRKNIKKEFYLSLFEVKEILNRHSYYCYCVKIEKLSDVKNKCFTLIFNSKKEFHYVVIVKVDSDYVYYYDPLFVFVRKQRIEEFIKRWSNICLFYTIV